VGVMCATNALKNKLDAIESKEVETGLIFRA